MAHSTDERDIDIVLVGSTGFVGRLVAGHLRDHAPESLRIAVAGRSRAKLDQIAAELGGAAASWPRLLVDVEDPAACADLATRSRVVVTTVGPYALHGRELVKACAVAGTHYADLTGEVLFVRDSADAFHEVAQRTGARIVHSCGFDSIPSDLGVFETARRAHEDGAGELTRTQLFVRQLKGGLSGGTIASMRQQAVAAKGSLEDKRAINDPYGLSPNRSLEPTREEQSVSKDSRGSSRLPVRRGEDGHWLGPFLMASYNTRVVRRTNALLGHSYGRGFRYSEVSDYGTDRRAAVRAASTTAGLLAVAGGMSTAPTRAVLDRLLPKPGTGPDAEARAKGRFRMEVLAETTSGARYSTTVAATADPGYNGTAIMLGQSALSLATDDLSAEGGVLTPAVAMDGFLAERLRAQGFTIETTRLED